jgi:SAM-dependent methyltransferase
MFDDRFLAAQQAYYCARAPEYDEWWERRGRYDHSPEANASWFREQEQVYSALAAFRMEGHVLELACGTGNFTGTLLNTAAHVTAMDGSTEMLALHHRRFGDDRIARRQADLFAWDPDEAYDGVFSGFWLSHVPPERLDGFLRTVRRALRPGGQLFFVDSLRDPQTTSGDQPLPEEELPWLVRRLNDAREFAIVKLFYEPAALQAALGRSGLDVRVRETERFFLYGAGTAR